MTDDLDRLIDSAAREMTDAPAPVDLRARVIAEIRREDEANASFHRGDSGGRRPGARVQRQLAWLAAAAGIILAAYLAWPEREPAAPTTAHAPIATPPPVEQPVAPVAPPGARAKRGQPQRTVGRPRPAAGSQEDTIASIPALAGPDSLNVAALAAESTDVARLTIDSLQIADLEIKPLTPPE